MITSHSMSIRRGSCNYPHSSNEGYAGAPIAGASLPKARGLLNHASTRDTFSLVAELFEAGLAPLDFHRSGSFGTVFYGDYMKPVQDLGNLMGFKVIEEGGPA